jgi:protein-S-isoprenylcysteine O-methyltransferase Ste14
VTVGYVPKGTSGRNTKSGQIAESLNTTGMYSLVRHPLYLGNFIIWFGISMFPMHWWLCVIFALVFWLYYERIVFAEEEFLRQKFGEAWLDWAQETPTFLPRIKGWKAPPLPFSWRSVLRREYSGVFGIVVCFYLLEVYSHVIVSRQIEVHAVWTVIFLAGLALYLTLRTLKKTTNVLAIEGR